MSAPTEDGRLARAALAYAAHGWPVLPLHSATDGRCSCGDASCASIGKHPRTRHGLSDATRDRDAASRWWDRWPDANIGVATGGTSRLLVLDVDLPDGPRSLARLDESVGTVPNTCRQRTGSGGFQLLYRYEGEAGNRTGLVPGIDVRGNGGYIVVPPSVHASGRRYAWTTQMRPVPAPSWLPELVRQPRARHAANPVRINGHHRIGDHPYAVAALHGELDRVAAARQGTRNDTLNRAAFRLGQLVGSGLLDRGLVDRELSQAALGIGLTPMETARTIASGMTSGMERPRPLGPALAELGVRLADGNGHPNPERRDGSSIPAGRRR